MSDEIKGVTTGRVEDAHGKLDELISAGAKEIMIGAVLVKDEMIAGYRLKWVGDTGWTVQDMAMMRALLDREIARLLEKEIEDSR